MEAINDLEESNGIRIGDMVEYRMGAREVVAVTEDTVFLEFDKLIREISIDEISLLNC